MYLILSIIIVALCIYVYWLRAEVETYRGLYDSASQGMDIWMKMAMERGAKK